MVAWVRWSRVRHGAAVGALVGPASLSGCSTAEPGARAVSPVAGSGGVASVGGVAGSPAAGSPAIGGTAGDGTGGVAAGAAGVAGVAGVAGAAGLSGPSCPEQIVPAPSGELVHLGVEFVAGSAAFTFGARVDRETDAYALSLLGFFLSRAVLVREDSTRQPVAFAEPNGTPRPYDLHLVRSDDPSSLSVDLLAPPGTYSALELGIGVPSACNQQDPTTSAFPLNASTGMYWTWATGYMFIRMEGARGNGETLANFFHHVGFDEAFRTVTLPATLTVPSPTNAELVLDLNRLVPVGTELDGGVHFIPDLEVADVFAAPGGITLAP